MIAKLEYPQAVSGTDKLNLSYIETSGNVRYGRLDRFGRITATKWQLGSAGTVIDHFTYGYDRNSNCLYKKNEHTSGGNFSEMYRDADGSKATAYDGLNRLTGFTRGTLTVQSSSPEMSIASDQRRQQFGYDALGNWLTFNSGDGTTWDLQQSRTNNLANEITGITETQGDPVWVDPAYDAAGSMISGPKPGDEATEHCYQYDAWNRLRRVFTDADSDDTFDTGENIHQESRYDGLNRRIVRIAGSGSTWLRTDFYFNDAAPALRSLGVAGWQIIEEKVSATQTTFALAAAASTIAKYQYVWDLRYIDSPVLRDEDLDSDGDCTDDEGTGSERLCYANDANFNVTALVETDGTVAERTIYDAYGQPTLYNATWSATIAESASKSNPLRFCGYVYDVAVGLYTVRYRTYHPTLGRWLQRDPAGYVDGMYLVNYVSSSPADVRDPIGLVGVSDNHPIGVWVQSDVEWNIPIDRHGQPECFGVTFRYKPIRLAGPPVRMGIQWELTFIARNLSNDKESHDTCFCCKDAEATPRFRFKQYILREGQWKYAAKRGRHDGFTVSDDAKGLDNTSSQKPGAPGQPQWREHVQRIEYRNLYEAVPRDGYVLTDQPSIPMQRMSSSNIPELAKKHNIQRGTEDYRQLETLATKEADEIAYSGHFVIEMYKSCRGEEDKLYMTVAFKFAFHGPLKGQKVPWKWSTPDTGMPDAPEYTRIRSSQHAVREMQRLQQWEKDLLRWRNKKKKDQDPKIVFDAMKGNG